MKKVVLAWVMGSALMTGCKEGSSTPWDDITKAAKERVTISLVSPDAAVKSWWAARDSEASTAAVVCKKISPVLIDGGQIRDIATGSLAASLGRAGDCSVSQYDREITQVDIQSETRALVQARIKRVLEDRSSLTSEDRETLDRGADIRYLLERNGAEGNWKISQVYQYRDYVRDPNDRWRPLYSSKKSINVYVSAFDQ